MTTIKKISRLLNKTRENTHGKQNDKNFIQDS